MSGFSTEQPTPTGKIEIQMIERGADETDLMLKSIATYGQTHADFSMGVTLSVRGATITGDLVGRNTWFRKLHEAHGDVAGAFTDTWKDSLSYDAVAEPDKLGEDIFIHLINARTLHGRDALPSYEGPGAFWRGMLAAVDGWSVGVIGPRADLPTA